MSELMWCILNEFILKKGGMGRAARDTDTVWFRMFRFARSSFSFCRIPVRGDNVRIEIYFSWVSIRATGHDSMRVRCTVERQKARQQQDPRCLLPQTGCSVRECVHEPANHNSACAPRTYLAAMVR